MIINKQFNYISMTSGKKVAKIISCSCGDIVGCHHRMIYAITDDGCAYWSKNCKHYTRNRIIDRSEGILNIIPTHYGPVATTQENRLVFLEGKRGETTEKALKTIESLREKISRDVKILNLQAASTHTALVLSNDSIIIECESNIRYMIEKDLEDNHNSQETEVLLSENSSQIDNLIFVAFKNSKNILALDTKMKNIEQLSVSSPIRRISKLNEKAIFHTKTSIAYVTRDASGNLRVDESYYPQGVSDIWFGVSDLLFVTLKNGEVRLKNFIVFPPRLPHEIMSQSSTILRSVLPSPVKQVLMTQNFHSAKLSVLMDDGSMAML